MSYTDQPNSCKSNKTVTFYSSTTYINLYKPYLGASAVIVKPKSMVQGKDIAVYGYGSVAWKYRMEEWKRRQNEKFQVVNLEGSNHSGNFGDELDDPDFPM